MKHGGLHIAHDSGKPASKDGLTVMIFHGLGFASGARMPALWWVPSEKKLTCLAENFARLVPAAAHTNSRVVLINRRDYPGAEPYNDAEIYQLRAAQEPTAAGQQAMMYWMRDRAREVYTLLEEWIADEDPPVGSLMLAFWSNGALWLSALLAYGNHFSTGGVIDVASYIRRLISYGASISASYTTFLLMDLNTADAAGFAWGYPDPPNMYIPLGDPSIPPEDIATRFITWVTGYYTHGADGNLEDRTPLKLTPCEVATCVYGPPAAPGASGGLLWSGLHAHGAATMLKEAALYPDARNRMAAGERESRGAWDSVELRFVWCDQSTWVCVAAAMGMTSELERSQEEQKAMRKVVMVRWRNANHFVSLFACWGVGLNLLFMAAALGFS
jgi:hypothetical protein